jgi:lysophospholipase L1-like esterase
LIGKIDFQKEGGASMNTKNNFKNFLKLFFVAILAINFSPGCGNNQENGLFYVALGDSLSVGVQPDANGVEQTTDNGYADQLFAQLVQTHPNLQLMKMGCPGETTTSMVSGGKCDYSDGSQLNQAINFLFEHQSEMFLVTIDIGVNDVLSCIQGTNVDQTCLEQTLKQEVPTNLGLILGKIFNATNRSTPVIGMNYYDPFLAGKLSPDPALQMLADASLPLLNLFNDQTLGLTYQVFGFPVADVSGKFGSNDTTPVATAPLPSPPFPPFLPTNVRNICLFTFMCLPDPTHPNIHATTPGYGEIATAFGDVLNGLGIQ